MPRFGKTTCKPFLIKSDLERVENFSAFCDSLAKLFEEDTTFQSACTDGCEAAIIIARLIKDKMKESSTK